MKIRASKLRLGTMLALLVLAACVSVPGLVSVTSLEGVLNGRAIVVRAPVSGRIEGSMPAIGDPVAISDRIASIRPVGASEERRRQEEAGVAIAELDGRIAALRAEIAAIARLADGLNARGVTYAEHLRARAASRVEQAVADLDAATKEAFFARERAAKLEALRSSGAVAELEASEARSEAESAEARQLAAAARLREAESEAAAAGLDINLADGQNDRPYSSQRLDELNLRRAALEAEIAGLEARRSALVELQASLLEPWRVEAPANAVVWRRQVAVGTDVLQGETLMVLVDCEDLFVQARIGASEMAHVAIGDSVVVEIAGRPGSVRGVVTTSRGTADEPRRDDAVAGLQLSGDDRWLEIEVAIDPRELRIGDSSFCNVGAGATVSFPRNIAFGF